MKRLAALATVIGSLALTGGAQAHNSHGWHWGEGRAELWLIANYDIDDASCEGYGHRWHGLYKHFDCFTEDYDGLVEEAEIHVTAKRRAVVRWF